MPPVPYHIWFYLLPLLCLLRPAACSYMYVLVAVPTDLSLSLTRRSDTLRQVTIPAFPRKSLLVNNIHALVQTENGKSSLAGASWKVKDSDKIFAWRGAAVPITVTISAPPGHEGVTTKISQPEESNGDFVYLVGCDESGCSVNSQLTKADWQQALEPLKSGKFGPFAELLSKWTDSTKWGHAGGISNGRPAACSLEVLRGGVFREVQDCKLSRGYIQ
eukprot:GHVS01065386.1.p1 GENE.GHVS01065386.1~~GHVS01065386.1.p1  ORF type:complete len:238 (-),score=21.67 GHVS01065386.1:76-729(-)